MTVIYIDADACPVKNEVYRVAERYQAPVKVVSNTFMAVPDRPWIARIQVDDGFDAADNWIAAHAGAGDVVISDDILLASRCLSNGARVIGVRGREFTEAAIGDALAMREVLAQLRDSGVIGGGSAPFQKKDRSYFLDRLDAILRVLCRR